MVVLLTVFLKCNNRTHETEAELWLVSESCYKVVLVVSCLSQLVQPGVRETVHFQFHKSSSSQLPWQPTM